MSQYAYLSEPDPELPEIPKMGGPMTPDLIPALRKSFEDASARKLDTYKTRLPPDSAYRLENHIIAGEGGDAEFSVRTISPTPTGDEPSEVQFPVLVFLHGGGWVAGSIESRDLDLRILSVELRISIVNVGYRLAPEHPFPAGLDDSYAAVKWTVENCSRIRGSVDKGLIVCGSSAGANITAAITHRALKDPFFERQKITAQILQIPAVVHPAAYPAEYVPELLSYEQNADAPILSKDAIEFFYECLGGSPTDPELSPLLAADHTGLPPAYLQICGLDPLRDEGLLYERLLREQGVRTRLDIYPGVPHAFSGSLPEMTASKKWEADLREGIKWALGSSV
ncbi:Alpha/Beta hydrolase protein [Mycena galopus ATCC 62051]|nr:Alpha/Beta hydrolase protein [Mycena galopus ATCC 62051]